MRFVENIIIAVEPVVNKFKNNAQVIHAKTNKILNSVIEHVLISASKYEICQFLLCGKPDQMEHKKFVQN